MTRKPEYQRAVCERLRRAAGYVQGAGPATLRQRLEQAARAVHVLLGDEFPADHRRQFEQIMTQIQSGGSIQDTLAGMNDDEMATLRGQIVQLFKDTCEG